MEPFEKFEVLGALIVVLESNTAEVDTLAFAALNLRCLFGNTRDGAGLDGDTGGQDSTELFRFAPTAEIGAVFSPAFK